jgi:hypothetical protein
LIYNSCISKAENKMTVTHHQTTENEKPKARVGQAVAAPLQGQVELTHQVDGLSQVVANTIQAQAERLSDPRVPTAQRQVLAAQIGLVQGNQHLQRVVSAVRSDANTVQRQNDEAEENPFQLRMPSFRLGSFGQSPSLGSELHLDPSIEAQMRALALMQQLDPTAIRTALLQIDPNSLTQPNPVLTPAPSAPAEPTVPAGAGPAELRAATGGDFMRAIMASPAIDQVATTLQERALGQVRRDWNRLSTGEQIATVSAGVVIGGGALAGAMSDPSARRFMLDQLNGRVLPVPGVTGLSVELNTERDNLMLGLHLDVGAFLPESWGFGPSSPSAIGGPPSPASGTGGR